MDCDREQRSVVQGAGDVVLFCSHACNFEIEVVGGALSVWVEVVSAVEEHHSDIPLYAGPNCSQGEALWCRDAVADQNQFVVPNEFSGARTEDLLCLVDSAREDRRVADREQGCSRSADVAANSCCGWPVMERQGNLGGEEVRCVFSFPCFPPPYDGRE